MHMLQHNWKFRLDSLRKLHFWSFMPNYGAEPRGRELDKDTSDVVPRRLQPWVSENTYLSIP